MLKRSRKVAVLAVCVMMFGVVQPAFAWGNRTGSREGDAVAYGAGAGTAAAIGAAALIFFTGGLATPFVVGAAAVAGVAGAAGGAYYGYNVEEKSLAKDTGVLVGAGAFGAGAGSWRELLLLLLAVLWRAVELLPEELLRAVPVPLLQSGRSLAV